MKKYILIISLLFLPKMICAQRTDITEQCLDSIKKIYSCDRAHRFWNINNLICVEKEHKYGVIDKYGNIIVPIQYDFIHAEEIPILSAKIDGKYGFLDSIGTILIPFRYEDVKIFRDRQVTSAKLNGKWGLINQNDSVILNFDYEDATIYTGINIFLMMINNKWQLFNENGKQIIQNKIDKISISFLSPGLFIRENNKWGKIDEFGNIIIPIKYEYINEVTVDRTVQAKRDGRYFLLENNGSETEIVGVSQGK
ncbi:hypothetical protein AGMMS49982_02560 [Bacteroidia bacterium]|nr:hypothetical protein AGMMS49982_02560 [Bacteroidia bacterium]